ncbi:hypothetical protein [Priestia megaterium]|uniref:hypothetical protein n=1 Tax=Priestia megaterium TaxID=1404 RepID=UPI0013620B23|nr:hypothetical protein [Priestia megaterium]
MINDDFFKTGKEFDSLQRILNDSPSKRMEDQMKSMSRIADSIFPSGLVITNSLETQLKTQLSNFTLIDSVFTPERLNVLRNLSRIQMDFGLKQLSMFSSLSPEPFKALTQFDRQIKNISKSISAITSKDLKLLSQITKQTNFMDSFRLSEPLVQTIASLDLKELQSYWNEEEVQEVIYEEILSFEEETEQLNLMQHLNNWSTKALNFPTTIKEKAPFLYLVIMSLLFIMAFSVQPVVEDVIKEKVWHESSWLENTSEEEPKLEKTAVKKTKAAKPKTQVKKLKSAVISDYPDAEQAIKIIRVTNRETPVYRSEKRKSGKIDIIQPNKPVFILAKKRNWSLVLYQNSYNEEVNGWVFTKNLTK